MSAPKKSLRPKTNPKRRMGPDDEGSTQHPSGKNMSQRQNPEAVTKSLRPKSRGDTKTYMNGGMVKNDPVAQQGYMDGGEVRRGDVRDNPKRGKCY